MITRLEQLHDRIDRSHPASKSEPVGSPFKRGDVALQRLSCWILSAGVLVATIAANPFLGVSRGLIQRGHDRARGRIRPLTRVNCPRSQAKRGVVVEDP